MRFYPILHLRSYTEQIDSTTQPITRACHPISWRVIDSPEFDVHSPNSLVGAGFASMGVGMFNIFRISPILFCNLVFRLKEFAPHIRTFKIVLISVILAWQGLLCIVLFFGGFILLFAEKIKKRSVLLLHPWGVLLLYGDVIVWAGCCLAINIELTEHKALDKAYFDNVDAPLLLFLVIYFETAFYYAGYCLYATYFIAAELSVIERFY